MEQAPKITIVGSINMDIVTITDQLPKMGETILGQQFQMNPGGKGANQAVASARLGAAVQIIGCVGEDLFGNEMIAHLNSEGVDVSNVEQVAMQTGTASITVSNKDNHIIVVPGANNHVTASFVEAKKEVIAASDILILQLEIPLEGVQKAVEIAKENGVIVILNPAPIRELPADLLNNVDYLTPNEHEIKHLTNEKNHAELIKKVILTKGSEGVSYFQEGKEINIPAYTIDVVDTTGAGDSFNAGFAVALGQGLSVKAACQYGNAVAALSTTKLGAQTGMPTAAEVQEFLMNKN